MILLSVEEIISLHEKMINKTGGSRGLRDYNLLESAVFNAISSYDGHELLKKKRPVLCLH